MDGSAVIQASLIMWIIAKGRPQPAEVFKFNILVRMTQSTGPPLPAESPPPINATTSCAGAVEMGIPVSKQPPGPDYLQAPLAQLLAKTRFLA